MITKSVSIRSLMLCAVMCFVSFVVAAQPLKIKAKAPDVVFVNEQFELTYILESDRVIDQPIEIGEMKSFDIIYGPSSTSSIQTSVKNGKRIETYVVAVKYVSEARNKGRFDLPKATLAIGGEKYNSDIAKLEVKSLQDSEDQIHAFIKTLVSRTKVGVSDTLSVTYRLYTTKEIDAVVKADFPVLQSDFFSSNITPRRQSFTQETVDGRVYKVVDLRLMILQPRSVGQKEIPGGEITLQYAIPTGRKMRDMWGTVYNEEVKKVKKITIDSATITVQDLQSI